jgi:phosphopantothenoylcysteine decarboxylase
MPRVLVLASGSVAAIKVPELVERLRGIEGCSVRLVVTKHARHFLPALSALGSPGVEVLVDSDEWDKWRERGDPVLHIELRKWADLAVVAPCSANTLAKLATGLADNLLTSTLRAWDFAKPVVVAPAMNTMMWEHPVTGPHVAQLESWGCRVLPTVTKTLVCGDTGLGAMAELDTIVQAVVALLN